MYDNNNNYDGNGVSMSIAMLNDPRSFPKYNPQNSTIVNYGRVMSNVRKSATTEEKKMLYIFIYWNLNDLRNPEARDDNANRIAIISYGKSAHTSSIFTIYIRRVRSVFSAQCSMFIDTIHGMFIIASIPFCNIQSLLKYVNENRNITHTPTHSFAIIYFE